MCLLIIQAWLHFIWRCTIQPRSGFKKLMHWLECTTGVMSLQLQILVERDHHSQPNTPERDFALWVMACCKSSILQTPSSFLLFRNFLHAAWWFQSKRSGVQTDELIRTETVERMEWASWKVLLTCWHYRWFMDNQPPTLSLLLSWDNQWLQEPLSPSFLSLEKLDLLGSGDAVKECC